MNIESSPKGQFYLGKQNLGLSAKVKSSLTYLGFDFSHLGAQYLYEIILGTLTNPWTIHSLISECFSIVANRHNTTTNSVERVTRLAIIKAHQNGRIGKITYFSKKAPSIKKMVNFMYDYFMEFDYMI